MTHSYLPIRSLLRGLDVLRTLNIGGTGPKTLGELKAATRLPKPTLVRLLETLIHAGYVSRGVSQRGYYLTSKSLWLSSGYGVTDLLVEASGPILERLCNDIGWPSDLMIFAGDSMVLCDTNRSSTHLTFDSGTPGTTRGSLPFSAAGRAYLAFCDEPQRRLLLERIKRAWSETHKEAFDMSRLERVLKDTRRLGYAVRAAGQCPETCAIASPIFLRDQIIGCLNVVYRPRLVADWELEARCVKPLKAATRDISSAIVELASSCGLNPVGGAAQAPSDSNASIVASCAIQIGA